MVTVEIQSPKCNFKEQTYFIILPVNEPVTKISATSLENMLKIVEDFYRIVKYEGKVLVLDPL